MSQRAESGDRNGTLLLAERTPVPDLPGLFRKYVVVGPEETGFLTSNGSVIRELPSGPNKVGWSVLGWGSGNREAVKLHNRPFGLRLHFSNLLSKGYEVHGTMPVPAAESPPDGAKIHVVDVSDGSNLGPLLDDVRPDEVYHLAAQSDVRLSFDLPIGCSFLSVC